ncbi:class I SAM-dependent methyltransferase [Confluentibacter citreus]|uniref:class I SAM-dependent methyltransferase n=1 Tax=Confluentibacter citreus TaxID=2007307 RepID=UPI000C287790|nr:class I SAM-dependent methyltransferase [Confluentibacter citreus]
MKYLLKKIVPNTILKAYRAYRKNNKPYNGKGVVCPICSSKFKYFGSYGVFPRGNAKCYTCGALERDRLLWKYFHEKVSFFTKNVKGKVLHFAPEKVFYQLFDTNKNIEYVPCDLTPERFLFNGKSQIIKANITNIPFEDNTYDFIICNHVLEHIPDDALAMSELYRVMKKGGQGIFQVPINYDLELTYEDFSITTPEGREKAFGQKDHVRWYGLDYKTKLEAAGFKVYIDEYVKSFTSKELKKYGLISTELIYNCSK